MMTPNVRREAREGTEPTLDPEEAARRFKDDPASISVPLTEIMRAFLMDWPSLQAELVAGRLVASGRPDGQGGYTDVSVDGDALLRWAALTGRSMPVRN